MAAPFSRLQLAAALIEYDNDSEDPSKPQRSAQESAVFLPFRNRPIRPERKSADYLGVSLPSETASLAPRESLAWDRKSRASIDALRNPFGRDSTYDGLDMEEEEDEIEVDLASWGLDALVDKDKDKDKEKEKAKQRNRVRSETFTDNLPNPYERVGRTVKPHARTQSMNLLNGLGDGGAFLDSGTLALGPRRHSIGDPLDAPQAYSSEPILPPRTRSPSAHALIDNLPLPAPLHSVPFPSSETNRSPSPQVDERRRTLSIGSRAMMLSEDPESDNPFAIRPPSPSRMSRFDPKVQQRARTLSHGTMATRMMLDDVDPEPDAFAHHDDQRPPRERRYSRIELMRPKVLIMPSPLQNAPRQEPKQDLRAMDGFELSTDGRPLPFGAKAARRSSVTLSVLDPTLSQLGAAPVASNSFTPNPRSSLTLSQLTFRNTLLVDGQRDVAYADIEGHLKRATEDGQQIEDELELEPEPETEPAEIPIVQVEEPTGPKRPAGKLYGKSLIDDLEARKAQMRGKQRVFRGDDRPSMMARTQTQRSSTLIAPDELKRPASQHLNSFNSTPGSLSRRNSANAKTLLVFGDEIPGAPRQSLHPGSGSGATTRSVFGVDTLWERELAKLKVIEEQERNDNEERARREAEEARHFKKGKKKKGKGKEKEEPPVSPQQALSPSPSSVQTASPSRATTAPPILPAIPKTIVRRAAPPPGDDEESDEGSDGSNAPAPPRTQQTSGWHSDEDDEIPQRTTGTGLRNPIAGPPRLPRIGGPDDDSSEEDVPLVATIGRAAQRMQARSTAGGDDSSDEEQPLSVLLDKTKQKLPSVSGGCLSPRRPKGADGEDEDDMPLGLRVSHAFAPNLHTNLPGAGGGDDDDKPLALHPDQLRKSQFYIAQAQQQQQQMLAQAQMAQMVAAQQSMIFGAPSMMGSGFFGPPMAAPAPMIAYPQLPPTPPPMQDVAKLGRVDKWRHDVAVEGQR